MSTQTEHERPDAPPPDDRAKEAMDSVIAHGPDGEVFEIPLSVAAQHVMSEERMEELNYEAPLASDDEVGGRHAVRLVDGTIGYHSNWLYGTYLWWRDQRWYTGWHWHPNRYNPAAYDYDDY